MSKGLTHEQIQERNTDDYNTANGLNRQGMDLDLITNPTQRQNTADHLSAFIGNQLDDQQENIPSAGTASERN